MRKNAEGSKVLEKGRESKRGITRKARGTERDYVCESNFDFAPPATHRKKSICSLDVEDTSQQVLVCWKRALQCESSTQNVVFVAASHLRQIYLRKDSVR